MPEAIEVNPIKAAPFVWDGAELAETVLGGAATVHSTGWMSMVFQSCERQQSATICLHEVALVEFN